MQPRGSTERFTKKKLKRANKWRDTVVIVYRVQIHDPDMQPLRRFAEQGNMRVLVEGKNQVRTMS